MIDKAIELLKILKNEIESNKSLCPFPHRDLIYSVFLNNNGTLKDEFINVFPLEKADEFYRVISIMGTAYASSGSPPNDDVESIYKGRISRSNLIQIINEMIIELNTKDNEEKVTKDIALNQVGTYDLFISHASEDKEALARPLAKSLLRLGYNVFLDELVIKLGDSITESINKGLTESKYCIIVISPVFLQKNWTMAELNSITNMYISSDKKILPIWHNITYEDIRNNIPLLTDLRAADSSKGIDYLVKEIKKSVGEPENSQSIKTNYVWNFHDFSEEVQISILKNLYKSLTDVELEFYHEALEEGIIYLDSIKNYGISDMVKQEFERIYKYFNHALREDEIDLWNDR